MSELPNNGRKRLYENETRRNSRLVNEPKEPAIFFQNIDLMRRMTRN